jgi:DNA-binding transcriptional regulator YiaG
MGPGQQLLSSWKEIAAFFGKGVRTVQRWEITRGLPVHRPGNIRSVVLADPEELKAWAMDTNAREIRLAS